MPSYVDQLYADIQPSYVDSLYHHGIKGMKWGVRRYRNEDGSVTSAGAKHVQAINNKAQLKSDLRDAKAGYKSARKSTNMRDVERAGKVDAQWDAANLRTKAALKSGKISKKEAEQQYNEHYDKAMGRYKKASDQYTKEVTRNKSQYHASRAKAYSKAASNVSGETWKGRQTKDTYSGKSIRAQAKSDLVKAKASGDKNAVRNARRTIAANTASRIMYGVKTGDMVTGAYKRYRDNGASRTKALIKANVMGSYYRD